MINFISCPKRIINLKRRPQRLADLLKKFQQLSFSNYEIFNAIDGDELFDIGISTPKSMQIKPFVNNREGKTGSFAICCYSRRRL